jgi:hypothetical protein
MTEPKTGHEKRSQTNLSSEYYVLSLLYRVGVDAYLSLGNKKKVDILVRNGNRIQTIDVKGVQGDNFQLGSLKGKLDDPEHYFVFVAFGKDTIGDLDSPPEVYVVPANELGTFCRPYANDTNNVLLKDLQTRGEQYRNSFKAFVNER